jgi:hypothetical protein
MSRWNFSFSATRPITGADFDGLLAGLRAHGYDVEPFYEGIRWRVEGRKDLRFASMSNFVDPVRSLRVGWEFVPDEVAFQPCAPLWCEANEFVPYADGDFAAEELLAIRAGIVAAFDAVENVIENEGRGILPTDSKEHARLFLHFDRDDAIEKWSMPSPRWPEVEGERLFKCWRCHCYGDSSDYETEAWTHTTAFDRLLGRYELRGTLPCCATCRNMNNVKWTPRVAQLLSTHPV